MSHVTSQMELQSLAHALRRPPLSLSELAGLPPERLVWLEQQVLKACEASERVLQRELDRAVPWPFRRLVQPRQEALPDLGAGQGAQS